VSKITRISNVLGRKLSGLPGWWRVAPPSRGRTNGASPGPADGSHFPAASASAEELIAAIRLEPRHAHSVIWPGSQQATVTSPSAILPRIFSTWRFGSHCCPRCIVDDTGRVVREVKVPSEPEALLQVLSNPA
jgi:hypothetical protein